MLIDSRVEESHCHPPDMVMPFENHCHVVTIHYGLSSPLQVQPRFWFCAVDIIDWLGIDPLQGPRKKILATNCIQSPPHLSHSISNPSSRCTLSWIFCVIFFLCFFVFTCLVTQKRFLDVLIFFADLDFFNN